ncbi:leukocyte-associated immunoglobulin-like receptor 1 [Otolemur garnettii]|uniref:leukocyte-associated immunoglobulin-like receptor 1 n=1 Tax=Otolemur garnettii TaxID=30611 RepID=UPI000C7E8E57|nr:leukocyte-associated immunoglobulin-like receptor 1 [Otolemur garnettii]
MTFHLTTLLGLGTWPKPSISAEPNTVISQGQPVTIVCRSPKEAELFRLEKDGKNSTFEDVKAQPGEYKTEARFLIKSISEDTAGRYQCLYHKRSWSERSDTLDLVMRTSPASTTAAALPSDTPTSSGLERKYLYVLIGVSAVFLLCLFLLVLLLHHQHQKKQGSPSSKDTEQKPQQRFNQAVDVPERKADVATADGLPEKDGEEGIPTSVARNSQEVTYAQLDHWALTQRPAQASSPQILEPVAEFSTYAAISRN